ncbi:MAG: (2Fe-2S)-binding protein [Elusimicrobia bacterium]|nr:(2Fe-2S)-binding protein [Elusimicrobiota bacterium]
MPRAPGAEESLVKREASRAISFVVNGAERTYKGPAFKRLIDVLREDFGLTGTKEGCGEGECGACTVLLDGKPAASCLVPVSQVHGRKVETVESLARGESLNPLQRSFLEEAAAQCGICTPGILLTAWSWVKAGGSADPEAVRKHLSGNLCRCTGYQSIVDAVVKTVKKRRAA